MQSDLFIQKSRYQIGQTVYNIFVKLIHLKVIHL